MNTVCGPLSQYNLPLTPALAGSTDTIKTTDLGRFTFMSSNTHVLGTGGSSFSTSLISGYIAMVTTDSSGGSTKPFYIRKLAPTVELEVTYSTVTSTAHPATTDIGKYIGFSSLATVAGCVLAVSNMGNAAGTTDGRWLKITGFSTDRRKITGFPVANSSLIAW